MKFLIRLMVNIVFPAWAASAQQAQPSPSLPLPSPIIVELPIPSGTPESQIRSDLLPESTALPAQAPDLRLPLPSPPSGTNADPTEHAVDQLSAEEQQKKRIRLSEIRSIAMRNPRVTELLHEANSALTNEAKREFMRAYYHTLCIRMRQLQPGLTAVISDYEHVQIRQLAQGPSRIAIVSREPQHAVGTHSRAIRRRTW